MKKLISILLSICLVASTGSTLFAGQVSASENASVSQGEEQEARIPSTLGAEAAESEGTANAEAPSVVPEDTATSKTPEDETAFSLQGEPPKEDVDPESNDIVVVYQPSDSTTTFMVPFNAKEDGVEVEETFETADTLASLVTITDGSTVEDKIKELEQNPQVQFAEPNYQFSRFEDKVIPNDPFFSMQTYLGIVNAPQAWQYAQTDQKITVAVLDTGVDPTHPDLAANVATSYNVIDGRTGYMPQEPDGHGSHVGGIIAGVANNGVGIAGVSYNARLLSVNIFYYSAKVNDWVTDYASVLQGIDYSVKNGARVVNMSFGRTGLPLLAMEEAMKNGNAQGVVFVAAAGNEGNSLPVYPSDSPYAISTVALADATHIASYSNYGPGKDIAAPGSNILSTILDGKYASYSGTSMAAPVVSGIAALILSINPNLSAEDVRNIICNTAADLGTPGRDDVYGYGRIDALACVKAAMETLKIPPLELDRTCATLIPSQAKQIFAKLGDTSKGISWKIENTGIATVSENGTVTGKTPGTTTLVATSNADGTMARCTIAVYADATQAFAARLYNIAMGRLPDAEGLAYWAGQLHSKTMSGAQVAHSFFNSAEFIAKGTSDTEYLECLYDALMDRKPDTGGLNYWLNFLENGYGRNGILIGFTASPEFRGICTLYGIAIGQLEITEQRDYNPQLTAFIFRLYKQVLNRPAEVNGLNYWVGKARAGMPLEDIASSFVFSAEFTNKLYDNETYIEVLYHAFMGRDPEVSGMNYWLLQMSHGTTRQQVLKAFVYSAEFKAIMAEFGL